MCQATICPSLCKTRSTLANQSLVLALHIVSLDGVSWRRRKSEAVAKRILVFETKDWPYIGSRRTLVCSAAILRRLPSGVSSTNGESLSSVTDMHQVNLPVLEA